VVAQYLLQNASGDGVFRAGMVSGDTIFSVCLVEEFWARWHAGLRRNLSTPDDDRRSVFIRMRAYSFFAGDRSVTTGLITA